MTLSDIGNIGEAIGAIAVVASLVYLAIQIRQNTSQMKHSSLLSRLTLQENFVSGQQHFFHALLEDEEFFRVWQLCSIPSDQVSEEDREKIGLLYYSQVYRYQVMYQARELEPLENLRTEIQIDRLVRLPSFTPWWKRQRNAFAFDEEFVELVDDRVLRSEGHDA